VKPRGSYDRSDYAWTTVVRDAAHFLMDEGSADGRPLSFQEIAAAVQDANILPGDLVRAAFQVEGLKDDRARGAEILTAEALKILKRSKLVEEGDDGWRWIGNGRVSLRAHGRTLPLPTKEERDADRARGRVEAQFLTREHQLPKRKFDPETADNKALIASLRTVGFDDDFPILVDEDGEIVSGYGRAAACEIVGIDWRDHTRTVKLKHTGPLGNIERTGKAVRANIGTGLSLATRRALAAKLKLEGHEVSEIAEALGISIWTAYKDTKGVAVGTVPSSTKETHVSDEELVSLFMEEIRAHPDQGRNFISTKVRERGFAFDNNRASVAQVKAKSRLATKAPEPTPMPPEPATTERFVVRRYKQTLVDGKVMHQELVEEWEEEAT
jgi:hypothetical protein